MRTRVALAGVAAAFALAAGGSLPTAGAAERTTAEKPSLKRVGSCGSLARYARRHARATIVREGDAERKRAPMTDIDTFSDPLAGSPPAAGGEGDSQGGGGGAEGIDFSGTNVQEEGIDEPDRVKTNGSHLFVSTQDVLYALDARADTPRVVGSVPIPGFEGELLLSGDRILAIAYGDADDGYTPATILSEIDVSNPAAMRVLRTEKVEGEYLSARLHGDVARVAIWTEPREIVVEQPEDEDWTPQERRARRRLAVRRAPVRTWRPNEVVADRTTGTRRRRGAVPCSEIRRPRAYAGLEMLSVLTVDLRQGLPAVDADAVFASGQTVYAGKDGMYIATGEWAERHFTSIHKFGIAGTETSYRASGAVPGYMLSQWSMSEHEGHLRTATTNDPPDEDGRPGESDSQVVVLAERDGTLVEVGRAGGLGRGERIYAVRFMGDRGFVVTFEEIDPLYTLDLSDPERPRVRGELKIPGFSAYLHPVGENLLLGVGQDVERGQATGLQLSLFDVADPANPRRTAVRTLTGDAYTDAEWDHHAFLYWPATRLAVIPLELYSFDENAGSQDFSGAIGFRVDGAAPGIDEVGRITSHREPAPSGTQEPSGPGWMSPPGRNLVVGDRLFSVWHHGVRVSRLDDLSPAAWVPLAR